MPNTFRNDEFLLRGSVYDNDNNPRNENFKYMEVENEKHLLINEK